jgi:hypothetical protein
MAISKPIRNILVIGFVVGAIVGSWAIWYVFYKPHRDVSTEKPAFELSSQALSDAFKSDQGTLAKYVDKAILIGGAVTSVEGKHVSLGNIVCSLDSLNAIKASTLKTGDQVKIQGRLTSYNDLMEEITLDNCVIK